MVATASINFALFRTFGGSSAWIITVAMWFVAGGLQTFLSTLSGVLYSFLRRDKEGADIETIAAVFD